MMKPVTAMHNLQQILKPALIDLLQVLFKCPIESSAKQVLLLSVIQREKLKFMIHRNGWQIDYTTEIWQPLCFCIFLFLRLWQSLTKIVIQLFRLDEKRLSNEASSFNFSLPVTILFSLVRTVHAQKGRMVHFFSFSLKFVHSYLKQHLNVYITIAICTRPLYTVFVKMKL